MGRLVSDLRFAARTLAGRPAFTLVAVLTLALGRRRRPAEDPSPVPAIRVRAASVPAVPRGADREAAAGRSRSAWAAVRHLRVRPFVVEPRESGFLAVRAGADPAALIPAVRREVSALDRNVPLYDIATMEQRLAGSVAARRFNLVLLGLFAALALALAGVGLYGVLGYAVTERTREIGVRMALGAQRRGVLGLILRQGLTLAAVGVGCGLVASFACSRLLRTSLFGITTNDPVTYVAIPFLLMLVALLSSYLPARRATRVDPLVTLRVE